jgi:hypothetical protein
MNVQIGRIALIATISVQLALSLWPLNLCSPRLSSGLHEPSFSGLIFVVIIFFVNS